MTKWTDDAVKTAILDDDLWKEFLAYARILPAPPAQEFMDALIERECQAPKRLTFSATGHLTTCPL